jgi:hypothetical protein
MIFMSQSGLTDTTRIKDWDAWYVEHLRIMASVPGIYSAQRFKTDSTGHPPSLAMYGIAGAHVFQDPYYLSVRGMGEWLPLIDRRHYKRNLFDGLDRAPRVEQSQVLIVADRDAEDSTLADLQLTWLACVGIDRSTRTRGIRVADHAPAARPGVGLYRPVTDCFLQRAAS